MLQVGARRAQQGARTRHQAFAAAAAPVAAPIWPGTFRCGAPPDALGASGQLGAPPGASSTLPAQSHARRAHAPTPQVDDEIEGLAGLDDEAEYQRFLQASPQWAGGGI